VKAGLKRGRAAELTVLVTPQMVVEFDGRPLHPFYPTYWACHHAEQACRRVIEPFLEEDEDGIGSGLFIHHHAPAAVGQTVHVIATASRIRGNHIICHFEMTESGRRIAHGDVHQVILPKARLQAMAEEFKEIKVQS
jgi:fluoroacetyl-CoA thioesterase